MALPFQPNKQQKDPRAPGAQSTAPSRSAPAEPATVEMPAAQSAAPVGGQVPGASSILQGIAPAPQQQPQPQQSPYANQTASSPALSPTAVQMLSNLGGGLNGASVEVAPMGGMPNEFEKKAGLTGNELYADPSDIPQIENDHDVRDYKNEQNWQRILRDHEASGKNIDAMGQASESRSMRRAVEGFGGNRGMGGGFGGALAQGAIEGSQDRMKMQQEHDVRGLELKMTYLQNALREAEAAEDRDLQLELQNMIGEVMMNMKLIEQGAGPPGTGGGPLGASQQTSEQKQNAANRGIQASQGAAPPDAKLNAIYGLYYSKETGQYYTHPPG